MIEFKYCIIKPNKLDWSREETILCNNYKDSKYMFIEKWAMSDKTEKINKIIYSNCIDTLLQFKELYPSWYDYVNGKYKELQGNICDTIIEHIY